MLVEAEPMLRLTLTKFLRRSDCEVTACPDGPSAVAALTHGTLRPALIVLCARVIDAETAATAHRLHDLAPAATMLGVADVIDPTALEARPLPSGMRFLAPPFDMPDVVRAVRSHLRRTRIGIEGAVEA
jgi:DNA-binding response OmpR family regulator